MRKGRLRSSGRSGIKLIDKQDLKNHLVNPVILSKLLIAQVENLVEYLGILHFSVYTFLFHHDMKSMKIFLFLLFLHALHGRKKNKKS